MLAGLSGLSDILQPLRWEECTERYAVIEPPTPTSPQRRVLFQSAIWSRLQMRKILMLLLRQLGGRSDVTLVRGSGRSAAQSDARHAGTPVGGRTPPRERLWLSGAQRHATPGGDDTTATAAEATIRDRS